MLFFYLSLIDDEDQCIKFKEIYTTYRMQMVHLAKSFLHSESDAEDVVHDVFLRIATKHMPFIQGLKNPDDIRNYLLKATKNSSLNELKRKDHHHVSLEYVSEGNLENIPNLTDDSFFEELCTKAEYEKVVKALISIDEPYRDIMYYHFVMELSVPDAAKHLGRNTATAKKQLVRGKKLLLSILGIGGDLNHVNN